MKSILLSIFLFGCFNIQAQTTDSLICLPKEQIISAATKLKETRQLNRKYEILISELKLYTFQQDTVIKNAYEMLDKKDIEIQVYRKALGDYGIQDGKLVWYKQPKVNFLLGVLTGGALVYVGTKIFTN